jgi:hypothetical protein
VPNGRILMAQELRSVVELTTTALQADANAPDVVACDDGALFLTQFTRLVRAGQAPRLSILDPRLAGGVSGAAAAIGARSVERGLGLSPIPILFHTAEPAGDELRALLGRVGRAVHLQRNVDLPVEEQSRRLAIAIGKLLLQIGGK